MSEKATLDGIQPPRWGHRASGPIAFARRYNEQLKANVEREIGTARPVPKQVRLLTPRIVAWTDRRAGGLIAAATF